MHLGVVHVTVREIDIACVHVVRNHWGVVDNAAGIHYLHKWTVARITDSPRLVSRWRELATCGTGGDAAYGRKINCSRVETRSAL